MKTLLTLRVNGETHRVAAEPNHTLLEVLREEFGLTGTKHGCELGECGECTPGMLMSAKALLDSNPHPTRDEIAQAISGNLCRCTGYTAIYEAIERAARATSAGAGAPVQPSEARRLARCEFDERSRRTTAQA